MIRRPAERTTDRRLAVPCTGVRAESRTDQDKPLNGPPTKRSDYRLRTRILEGITHRREHSDERRQDYPTRRTASSIRRRLPDDAQWREPLEDKTTRRRAVARAFGGGEYPTRRTAASIRHLQDETRIPDDAQWREHSPFGREEDGTRRRARYASPRTLHARQVGQWRTRQTETQFDFWKATSWNKFDFFEGNKFYWKQLGEGFFLED